MALTVLVISKYLALLCKWYIDKYITEISPRSDHWTVSRLLTKQQSYATHPIYLVSIPPPCSWASWDLAPLPELLFYLVCKSLMIVPVFSANSPCVQYCIYPSFGSSGGTSQHNPVTFITSRSPYTGTAVLLTT